MWYVVARNLAKAIVVGLFLVALMFGGSNGAEPGADGGVSSQLPLRQQAAARDGNIESGQLRLREGTTIDSMAGFFRQDGDGATFVTDEGLEFGGLPNLNLERVARTLKGTDESKSVRWRVSGLITEFSGQNFILISRAIYKSTAPPPVPERLSN
ncbi:MAG: hypothetical protein KDA57_12545 [Planctomycetales bacterium]|nr:hypothetical protein [Planctomycetales bacterium]